MVLRVHLYLHLIVRGTLTLRALPKEARRTEARTKACHLISLLEVVVGVRCLTILGALRGTDQSVRILLQNTLNVGDRALCFVDHAVQLVCLVEALAHLASLSEASFQ